MIIKDNDIVLFQGDSITDADRIRESHINLGNGYVMMAAALFSAAHPEIQVQFLNRGISGNRVIDLQSRWKKDCLDLQPTLVSIMIGINDCWRRFDSGDPTSVEEYEKGYRDILKRTRENTKAEIILIEPFVLPVPEDRKEWREDLDPKINAVRKLAQEFGTMLIPLDGIFSKVASFKRPEFWAEDGVHPTAAGHALIAKEWLQTVGAL